MRPSVSSPQAPNALYMLRPGTREALPTMSPPSVVVTGQLAYSNQGYESGQVGPAYSLITCQALVVVSFVLCHC